VRAWEYKKIVLGEVPRKSDEMALLCDAGEDGWELVAILANNVAYLKREVTGSIPEAAEDRSDEVRRAEPAEVNSHPASASLVKPKYRDPTTGETWSGRGRMATWLKRKQDAGEDIDKYLV